MPPSGKKHGHLKTHPILECLLNTVDSDFFYPGELDHEECPWTSKKINEFPSFCVVIVIEVLLCTIQLMTGKAHKLRLDIKMSHLKWLRTLVNSTPPNGKNNFVPALESNTESVKSSHTGRRKARVPAAR